ncbi:MAG: ABC transporter [Chloroflexi bacterium]|nr:MAG: ABC transporter [Chloroflexota bacterium]
MIVAEPEAAPTAASGVVGVGTRSATLRAVYMIWYRDVLKYWRDRVRLIASLAQPLLFLLVFGLGLSSSLRGAGGGFGGTGGSGSLNYVQFVFPGVVAMAVLFTAIFSAMSIVWDREFGFLKEILVAPVDRSAVAVGKALGGATQAMLQGCVMLVFAPLVGVHLTLLSVVELVPLLFVLAFALSSLGVAVASRMRSMQGFQVVMNFMLLPIFFLSGALFPLSGLPGWMTVLTRLDPVAYGVAPLRHAVLGGAGVPAAVAARVGDVSLFGRTVPTPLEVVMLLLFGVAALAVAIRGFRIPD